MKKMILACSLGVMTSISVFICHSEVPYDPDEIRKEISAPTVTKWLFPEELKWLKPTSSMQAASLLAHGLGIFGYRWRPDQINADNKLRLKLTLPTKALGAGDELVLNAKFHNESKSDLWLNLGPTQSDGFQARVFDENGKFYWGLVSLVEGSFPLVQRDHFKRISPKESMVMRLKVRAIRDFDNPQSHAWQTVFPGHFLVSLTYSNHDHQYHDGTSYHRLTGAWVGQVISNSVQFKVE